MIELSRSIVAISLDGKDISIRKPNLREYGEYQEKLLKDNANELDLLIEFICLLGMEKDTCLSLEPEHLEAIIEGVLNSKKK